APEQKPIVEIEPEELYADEPSIEEVAPAPSVAEAPSIETVTLEPEEELPQVEKAAVKGKATTIEIKEPQKQKAKLAKERKSYTGRRMSLDFKKAYIHNVLRLIAEVSNLNIITYEEVGGDISLRLINVPWDQALDVILTHKGYGMRKMGNILRIATSKKL